MAQILVLERYCYSERMGVFGRVRGVPFACHTVEQPWRGNAPFVSCIPEGLYQLAPVTSPRFARTYALVNPELRVFASQADCERDGDRYACLIHAANRASELQGCIAPGESEGVIGGEWAVLRSGITLTKLLAYIGERNIKQIHITRYAPEYP